MASNVACCSLASSAAVHRVFRYTPGIYNPWIFPRLNVSTETSYSFGSQSSAGGRYVTELYASLSAFLLLSLSAVRTWNFFNTRGSVASRWAEPLHTHSSIMLHYKLEDTNTIFLQYVWKSKQWKLRTHTHTHTAEAGFNPTVLEVLGKRANHQATVSPMMNSSLININMSK